MNGKGIYTVLHRGKVNDDILTWGGWHAVEIRDS